jgi:hypothetical protein
MEVTTRSSSDIALDNSGRHPFLPPRVDAVLCQILPPDMIGTSPARKYRIGLCFAGIK